ncbi:MAG: response regulator [Myxococcales bacterium]|nr:MAG: response regulator [Myxococcales bacterium]
MSGKIRLMFVDDEEKFLANTASRLRMRGIEVAAFNNGPEALAYAEQNPIEVALLDLKMPGMDGEEVLKKLKEKRPLVEVIILTGHGSIRSAADCTKQGAYEYLLKPCEIDEVITAISNAYARAVKAKSAHKAERVNEILAKAIGYSPIQILQELQKLDEE